MKQVFHLALFLFFSVVYTVAQPPAFQSDSEKPGRFQKMSHDDNMEKILMRLDEQVSLSTNQKNKIRNILEETTSEIRLIEKQYQPQKDEVKMKLAEIRNSNDPVLTKRQRIRDLKDQYAPNLREFKTKISSIRQESRTQINKVLTTEQKAVLYELMSEQKFKQKEKNKDNNQRKRK